MKPTLGKGLGAALVASSLLFVSLAQGDEHISAEKAVDYRTSYMTLLGWHSKPMIKMVKGELEFNDEAFLSHALQLATVTRLDLLPAFPEDSTTDDSDAKDEIWFSWDDFEQKLADFRSVADKLGAAASMGDVGATKAAFGDVGKACKACHKKYKE